MGSRVLKRGRQEPQIEWTSVGLSLVFGVLGFGFGVWCLGFRVWGLESEFAIEGLGIRVWGLGFEV